MTNLEYLIPIATKNNAIEINPIPELRVWTWEQTKNDKTIYMLLVGSTSKRKKKALAYEYSTKKEWRDIRIEKLITNISAYSKRKEAKKAEKKNFKHTLKVGDILVRSWGYEQTNINFYQVTKLVGKTMIEYKSIYKEYTETPDIHSRVIASKDNFINNAEPQRAKVQLNNRIKINSYSSAYLWNEKPMYETNSLYGH